MTALSNTSIYKLVILSFAIPLYSYGLYEWIQNKRHFVISNRFPIMSYLIICLAFILLLTSFIEDILYDLGHSHNTTHEISKFIKIGFFFCLSSLSTSRTFLIYLRFRIQQQLSLKQSISDNINNYNVYNHILFKLMMIYSLIGTLMIASCYFIGFWPVPIFLGSLGIFIILISLIMIKNRVSDGLGCIKENYFIMIASIIIIFLSAKFSHAALTYFGFGFVCFEGFITLYLPLLYIYKIKRATMSNTALRINQTSEPNELAIDFSYSEIQQPLYVFLRKQHCYSLFREYLAHCFAVESLLFVEKVVVLWNLLNKKYGTQHTENININVMIKNIFDIKFEYLYESNCVFKEYKEKISNVSECDKQKTICFNIYRDIFNEYISSSAAYQINLPYLVQQRLNYTFLNKNGAENIGNIDDFLLIFNDAVIEAYTLMSNVFAFNFKKFGLNQKKTKKKSKKQKKEENVDKLPSLAMTLSNLSKKNQGQLSVEMLSEVVTAQNTAH